MKIISTLLLSLTFTFNAIAGGCTPPDITSGPAHKAVCENGNTYFRVIATGPSLVYQWQINQGSGFVDVLNAPPFSGATTDSLIITAAPVSLDNSVYRCVVSNGCVPNDTSINALLKISGASSILTQPVNTIGCEGGITILSMVAAGTGLTYQWQVNDGSGFLNVPAALPYSGDTTANLTITNPSMTLNGYVYQVVINAGCSSALISSPATLSLDSLPEITAQPSSVMVCDGDITNITVSAVGSGLAYQWQLNSGSGYSDLSNAPPYSGVTTSALTINPASYPMNGFLYRCIVSGNCAPPDTGAAVTLVVNETYAVYTNATICHGDSYVFGTSTLTAPGFYSNVLTTENSCDSTVYLSLSVNMSYFTTTASTICANDSVLLGPAYQSAPGIYTFILPAMSGCDSTIEHTLSNYPSYVFPSVTTICEGDSVLIFGTYETMDSVYSEHYFTFQGCDSIYTHELIVNPSYDYAVTANICQGDSILLGGFYHSTPGVFTYNYTTVAGCDSIVKTTVNVNPLFNLSQNISICANDSVFLAGAYQNASGVYTDSLLSVSGCDSVMVTTLTVGAIPFAALDFSVITGPVCAFNAPFTLTGGSPAGGVYSGPGVTSSDLFSPASVGPGLYEITYTYTDSAGCSVAVTDSLLVEVCGGMEEFLSAANFSFYPNPFSDQFSITSESGSVFELNVYTILGELVIKQQLKQGKNDILFAGPAGVYFAEIRSGNTTVVNKLIKR